jgi:hypothetical protein
MRKSAIPVAVAINVTRNIMEGNVRFPISGTK